MRAEVRKVFGQLYHIPSTTDMIRKRYERGNAHVASKGCLLLMSFLRSALFTREGRFLVLLDEMAVKLIIIFCDHPSSIRRIAAQLSTAFFRLQKCTLTYVQRLLRLPLLLFLLLLFNFLYHRRRKVEIKKKKNSSVLTFLLSDPGWCA